MLNTPTITFYGTNRGAIAQKFLDMGYAPLMDTVHGSDLKWLNQNYVGPHRFYNIVRDMLWDSSEAKKESDFSIAFNMGEDISDDDWQNIHSWCFKIIFTDEKVDEVFQRPCTQVVEMQIDEGLGDDEKTQYEFRFEVVNGFGIYEVWKPNTDRPYTVVVEDYLENGHISFFSSLFICDSWGVATADFQFLSALWKHLNMDGDYDGEVLLKNHTEECKNGKPEPRVYRKNFDDVVKLFTEKGGKRMNSEDERYPKRVVLK